jgi:hypothetical protein
LTAEGRKSVEPMAAVTAPARVSVQHHCCPAILLMARGKSLVENRKKDFLSVTDFNLDLETGAFRPW